MNFILDERLNHDCFTLAETATSLWLLLDNSHFPWFIIVPKTEIEELYQLPAEQQKDLQQQSTLMSEFITANFPCDKLNVACIGNIVKQMHLHIIGRTETDPCWPGVVWGTEYKRKYDKSDVEIIHSKLKIFCQQRAINDIKFVLFQ